MAHGNPTEDPDGGNDQPEWFIRWLSSREPAAKTPQLIKIEEDLGNLEVLELVKSKIWNDVILETTAAEQKKKERV